MKFVGLRAVPVVAVLLFSAAPHAVAEGGNSGRGNSSQGNSGSGSGNSGSGSSGSGSGKNSTSSLKPNDDASSTSVPTSIPTVPPTQSPTATVGVIPSSTRPANQTVSSGGPPTTMPQPASPTTVTSPVPTKATGGRPSDLSERQVERTTSCGSYTLRVVVRSNGTSVRLRSTIDRTNARWSAVVLQERRVVWRGIAAKGRVDLRFTALPGPQLVAVRLTNTSGAVCALELQLLGDVAQ